MSMNPQQGEVQGSTTSTKTEEGRFSNGRYAKTTQNATFANSRSTSTSSKRPMSSRIPHATTRIGHIRGPWIPAPAKATNVTGEPIQHQSSHPAFVASSTSSYGSVTPRPKSYVATLEKGNTSSSRNKMKWLSQHNQSGSATTATQKHHKEFRHVRKSTSKVKLATKHGSRHIVSGGYKLQSKDSLVDVTACLQAKRAEVMILWEKLLLRDDPQLLSQIEKTNRLALEAAEEVESLRKTIHDFQKKDDGLSESDLAKLEGMRGKVLEKVREFEEADNELQSSIVRKSPSKISLVSTVSKKSQTDMHNDDLTVGQQTGIPPTTGTQLIIARKSHSSPSVKELVFLKEKSPNFAEDSQSEEERMDFATKHQHLSLPKSVDAEVSAVPSMDDLTRLKLLYDEALNFPPINNITESRSNVALHTSESWEKQSQSNRTVRFMGGQPQEVLPESTTCDGLYRQKISSLQRKLMDTEQEMEELKSEIERIESDANFRSQYPSRQIRQFRSNPEYLHMVEQRLHETGEVKVQLQTQLQSNQKSLHEEKELNKVMKKEADELKERLRTVENSKDILKSKNSELEANNMQLRKELESITRQMAEMSSELRITKEREANACLLNTSPKLAWENEKLKLQCSELTDQLGQSQRIIESLKKSKAKQAIRLNERIEELIEALNEVHDHKRQLCDTIRNLRKSYYRLFPDDVYHVMCQKSSHSKKSKTRKKRPAVESKIEQQTAWRTGAGGFQDNLNSSDVQSKAPMTAYQTSLNLLDLTETKFELEDDHAN
ncbi:hypothetical protein Ocin01_06594 [Orchesella cincta]|uniref:Uncharacterized protein n=1 Tax=Orchesella cincta TaxID=48709 RepID=A0A1D2N481_ORCCI|nr:hypothetical protein Ocin01_06594 [Orchesella cincta]